MASSQTDKNEKNDQAGATDDTAEIKHKLAMRMAFAGVMIVALLGGLALFDYYSAQPEPEVAAPPQFTAVGSQGRTMELRQVCRGDFQRQWEVTKRSADVLRNGVFRMGWVERSPAARVAQ